MNGTPTTESTYRGYTIRVYPKGVRVYDVAGEYVDSFASTAHARPAIDDWVEGSVR